MYVIATIKHFSRFFFLKSWIASFIKVNFLTVFVSSRFTICGTRSSPYSTCWLSCSRVKCGGLGAPGGRAHLWPLGPVARHLLLGSHPTLPGLWARPDHAAPSPDGYVEAQGTPGSPDGPTPRATMEGPGLVISCAWPAALPGLWLLLGKHGAQPSLSLGVVARDRK